MSRDQVRHLVRSGRCRPVRRGVFVMNGAPDTWEQRASIALLACGDGAALAGRCAGSVLGFVDETPRRIEVVVPYRKRNASVNGIAFRRIVNLGLRDVRTIKRLRVTCPARTLVDLAASLPDRALARALDGALLRGLTTLRVVRRSIDDRSLKSRPGAKRLLALLDDREFGVPESELERRLLELIEQYRLPSAQRQHPLGPHRVDFLYDEQRIVVEVEGRATHGTTEAFEQDPRRQNSLALGGCTVLRFTWTQITEDADYVAATIRRALE